MGSLSKPNTKLSLAIALLSVFSCTWAFDNLQYFRQLNQADPPVIDKYGAHEAMALGDDILIFGGLHENRTTFWQEGSAFVEFHGDTRVFNTKTGTHSRLQTADNVEPPPRSWFTSTSNGVDKAFIYGGLGPGFSTLDDFWMFDKQQNRWIQKGGSSLSMYNKRQTHSPERRMQRMRETLARRGSSFVDARPSKNNDLSHQFKAEQQQRMQYVANTDNYPGDLQGAGMTIDTETDELFLYGGQRSDFITSTSNVWRYDMNTEEWELLEPAPGSPVPLGRTLSEVRLRKTWWGGNKRYLVMYGGEAFFPDFEYYRYVCDMWMFNLDDRVWRRLDNELTSPACRLHYSALYEPLLDQMHFHGGDYGNCTCTDLVTSRTMIFDFKTEKFVDNVYGRDDMIMPPATQGPPIKRSKFTRMNNGKTFMTGGYTSENPGNSDQNYPGKVYEYQSRNIHTLIIRQNDKGLPVLPQEKLCPSNDEFLC